MYTSHFKKKRVFVTTVYTASVYAATACLVMSKLNAKEIEYYCTDMSTLDWQSVEHSTQRPINGYWKRIMYGSQRISAFFVNEADYQYGLSFCEEGWVLQPYSLYWLPFVVTRPDGSQYLAPFHFGDWSLHTNIEAHDSRVDFNPPFVYTTAEMNFQLRV